MNKFSNTAIKNDSRWDLALLRQDLKELQRERIHLTSKGKERTLTVWELQRSEELLDEIMQLMKRFCELSSDQRPSRTA